MHARYLLILPLLVAFFSLISFADDREEGKDKKVIFTTKPSDQRLPPLLPGQHVSNGSGGTMRVWTTAGPVPVSSPNAPSIDKDKKVVVGEGASIIVDRR